MSKYDLALTTTKLLLLFAVLCTLLGYLLRYRSLSYCWRRLRSFHFTTMMMDAAPLFSYVHVTFLRLLSNNGLPGFCELHLLIQMVWL